MSCEVGDIIVVRNYTSQGQSLGRHSFVVLSTEHGQIQGLDYDLVCNVMSSFHSEEHREKKLRYPGNFEYSSSDELVEGGHGRPGFIKADQIYYFNSDKLDYYVIGNVLPNLLTALIEFVNALDKVEHVIDNLYTTS